MACLPNIQTLQNLDFSSVNDAANWSTNGTNIPATVGGKLILNPTGDTIWFDRALGIPDPTNNRIRVRCKFDLNANAVGPNAASITFTLSAGLNVLGEGCAEFVNVSSGIYSYYFDKTFNLSVPVVTSVTLRIQFPNGSEYDAELETLIAEDFNFCQDNIRTYFALDGFFAAMQSSVSSAIELLRWEVDGVETLTALFFSENNIVGSNPATEYLFAEAELDGSDRIAENVTPNTFNPFYEDWGLDFANVAGNYFGGKTIGTRTGSDYGSAILNTGIDIPIILNGVLEERLAPFFIDLNYEESFIIEFNVLVNNSNSNPYIGPTIYRTYTISFDKDTCVRSFTYFDQLSMQTIDVNVDGFLYGLTPQLAEDLVVACGAMQGNPGQAGNTVYTIEYGADIGLMQFNYNAMGVPDRFIFDWDGNQVDTGFVGLDSFDTDLLNAGVLPGDINTTPSGNGQGSVTLNKANAAPSFVTVTVLSPLEVNWNIMGLCVGAIPPQCSIVAVNPIEQVGTNVDFNLSASDVDGTIASWSVDFGDGNSTGGAGSPPASVSNAYAIGGIKTVNLFVVDNDGNTCTSTVTVRIERSSPALVLETEESNNCYSCLLFSVNVPMGQNYSIQTISNFIAGAVYATEFPTGCFNDPEDGTLIALDTTIFTTTGGFWFVGIDAGQGSNNTNTSTITVIVRDGASQVVGQYVLSRQHQAFNC